MLTDILFFIFVGIMCIWAWDRINHIYQSDDKKDPVGTLVILYDSVDREKHFALEIEEDVLQAINDGDSVVFTAKVLRQ